MNLKNICIRINAFFCLGSTLIVLWGYNRDIPLATTVALVCLPVVLAAGLGWRAALTGRWLPVVLFLAGAMIPYGIWLQMTLEHIFFCFPAMLGLIDLCLLPVLKKRRAWDSLP